MPVAVPGRVTVPTEVPDMGSTVTTCDELVIDGSDGVSEVKDWVAVALSVSENGVRVFGP